MLQAREKWFPKMKFCTDMTHPIFVTFPLVLIFKLFIQCLVPKAKLVKVLYRFAIQFTHFYHHFKEIWFLPQSDFIHKFVHWNHILWFPFRKFTVDSWNWLFAIYVQPTGNLIFFNHIFMNLGLRNVLWLPKEIANCMASTDPTFLMWLCQKLPLT